jgi:chaperonin cofactor prefoldin
MDRVGKLEKEVAVIENRLDTVEAEISTIRGDIKILSSKMDKMTGLLMAWMGALQLIATYLKGG